MVRLVSKYTKNDTLQKIVVVLVTGVTAAIALNIFLTPANVFAAGVNGISQILSSIIETVFHIHIDTGIFIFTLNVPVAILGWIKLGKKATIYSLLTVISVTICTLLIPVHPISDNPLMNAIVGGVLVGVGAGLALKFGFTTGGMDIVSLILAKTTGRTVGTLMFAINSLIILFAGFAFDWESALYTIISIYCMTQVVDAIHTSHQKVTALIMTSHAERVSESIQEVLVRGLTLLPSIGGFSKTKGHMIVIVVTRYELYDLEQAVRNADAKAFVDIIPTQNIFGKFWNEEQQNHVKTFGFDPLDK